MQQPSPSKKSEASLSHRTSRGFLWMVGQTVGSKFFGIIGQIFLARLLSPRDFGLVAMTYNAVAVPALLRQTGIPQILVQKQGRFARWANAAFWAELALGIAGGLCMAAAIPLATQIFHTKKLIGPMLIVASVAPINALSTVPMSSLSLNLRFREIAAIGFAYNVLAMLLSVALAFMGWGVYSFVAPLPVVAALRTISVWWLAPQKIRLDAQPRRWVLLAGDSATLLACGGLSTLSTMALTTLLGVFATPEIVGQIFFAGNLVSQVVQVLATNLAGVLFPALSTLKKEPKRQAAAFLRAARSLALAGIPICIASAVMARPLVFQFFGTKWQLAAVAMPISAVAAAFTLVGGPAQNLLQAQGRFRSLLLWYAISTTAYLPILFVIVQRFGAIPALLAYAAYSAISVPWLMAIGLAPTGQWAVRLASVTKVIGPPVLMACTALAPVALLQYLVPEVRGHYIVQIITALATAPAIYLALAWRFCPKEVDELLSHAGPLGRLLPRPGRPPNAE